MVSGRNIVEVGPGYGALTEYLLDRSPVRLDLVELDKDLVTLLVKRYDRIMRSGTLHVHSRDVLQFVPEATPYAVIANIPYYITSPILFRFLYDLPVLPDELVILMQKEVGEKILAKDGKTNLFSLSLMHACDSIEEVCKVSRGSFSPAPKVDSIVLRFRVKRERDRTNDTFFLRFAQVGFAHPRKKLVSNLRSLVPEDRLLAAFAMLGLDEGVRGEALSREQWENLAKLLV